MRKLVLLSSVFALSFGVFAQKDANSFSLGGIFGAATGIGQATVFEQNETQDRIQEVEQAVRDNTETLQTEIYERFMNLFIELRKMSEQAATVQAASTTTMIGGQSASNQEHAITTRNNLVAERAIAYSNAGGQNCVVASGAMSGLLISEGSEKEARELAKKNVDLLAAKAGTDAENGGNDYRKSLAKKRQLLCDPAGYGGADVGCTGDGLDAHVNFASILEAEAFEENPDEEFKRDYLQEILIASRNPVDIPPDLLANQDTDTEILLVKADRLKAELSAANAVISKIRANRKKLPASVSKSLKDRLVNGGASPEKVKELTEGGVSQKSMLYALTVGSHTTEMLLQKTNTGERDLLANIFGELALNNVMQYHVYEMLEALAATSAINLAGSRDETTKDLDAIINVKKSRGNN